jgi:hypothetical protein
MHYTRLFRVHIDIGWNKTHKFSQVLFERKIARYQIWSTGINLHDDTVIDLKWSLLWHTFLILLLLYFCFCFKAQKYKQNNKNIIWLSCNRYYIKSDTRQNIKSTYQNSEKLHISNDYWYLTVFIWKSDNNTKVVSSNPTRATLCDKVC